MTLAPKVGMDTRDPNRVRALESAIDVLTILNQYNGMSILEIVRATGIQRARAYRIMVTLINEGYAFKSKSDDRYRLTEGVRELSYGFQQPSWLEVGAAPLMDKASAALPWPLSLVALYKNQIISLYSTDISSALLTRRISVGTVIPVLASAAGLVFLSFSDSRTSEILLSLALSAGPSLLRVDNIDLSLVRLAVKEASSLGYCAYQGSNYRGISVPVYRGNDLFAALSMRSSADDPWPARNDALYVPHLKEIAGDLQAVLESAV